MRAHKIAYFYNTVPLKRKKKRESLTSAITS